MYRGSVHSGWTAPRRLFDVHQYFIPHVCACRQLYSAEPVWEEPEDLRTMLDESTFEVTEEMVRSL